MGERSKIEWTDHTINFWMGCTKISPACDHCYAEGWGARSGRARWGHGEPRVKGKSAIATAFKLDRAAAKAGRRDKVFCNSLSDFFDAEVPNEWRDEAFAVMALTPHLDWLVLTKRPKVMREYMWSPATVECVYDLVCDMAVSGAGDAVLIAPGIDPSSAPAGTKIFLGIWPLPNVWLGVTAENQDMADLRIPELLRTPAAKRFVSCEPLLGPVNLRPWLFDWGCNCGYGGHDTLDHCPNCGWVGDGPGDDVPGDCPGCGEPLSDHYACPECKGTCQDGSGFGPNSAWLSWVIAGGESGRDARPMHPDWARSLRDQCVAAGVPFFFKQWGEWIEGRDAFGRDIVPAEQHHPWGRCQPPMARVGKERAGRLLDGRLWNEFPT